MQSINQPSVNEKTQSELMHFSQIMPKSKLQELSEENDAGDKRRRKLPIEVFFWLMVVGVGSGKAMKLKEIGQLLSMARLLAGEDGEKARISKEALSEQMSQRSWTFFRAVFDEIRLRIARKGDILMEDMRVFLVDATAVRVALTLITQFPGNRIRQGKVWAGIKLHLRYGLMTHLPEIMDLTAQIRHEVTVKFLVPSGQAALYIFDLGYWKYDLLRSIVERGQHFITRCKSVANPMILAVHQGEPGWIGKRLKDIHLSGQAIDVLINLSSANVSNPRLNYELRLVGRWNEASQRWHLYITSLLNLSAFAPGVIIELYRMRWQIEIFFRNLKCVLQMDHFISTSENGIRIQIYAALIFHLLTELVMKEAAQTSGRPLVDFSFPYCAEILRMCLSYSLFRLWVDNHQIGAVLLKAISLMGLRPNRSRIPSLALNP